MDVMDEEINDERQARINQYGSEDVYSLRRLKHELGCRSDGHAEAEAMLEYKREGNVGFSFWISAFDSSKRESQMD